LTLEVGQSLLDAAEAIWYQIEVRYNLE
jgi:hypothetical protein